MSEIWIKNQYDEKWLQEYKGNEDSVTIPEGFTGIMPNAFANNENLKEVIFPSTITAVREWAFLNCKSLKRVVFNKDIKTIWLNAFRGCESLEEFVFPKDCEKYESVNGLIISKDEHKIEMAAEGISGSVVIPNGIEEINTAAFQEVKKITKVVFPDTLRVISLSAFEDCDSLEEVVLPESIESIESGAFGKTGYYKTKPISLLRISIPANLKNMSIDSGAFYYDDKSTVLVYPELPIDYISDKEFKKRLAFGFCLNPDSYKGDYYDCYYKYVKSQKKNLINAAKKAGVQGIEEFFEEDEKKPKNKPTKTNTQQEKKPTGKKSVAEYRKEWTFIESGYDKSYTETETISGIILTRYKGNETELEVPERIGTKLVVGIDACAFADNNTITSVEIPESIYGIGDRAFVGCGNLKKVIIKGKDIKMGSRAFSECKNLEVVDIAASKIRTGVHPFLGCEKLMDEQGLVVIGPADNKVLCDIKLPIEHKRVVIPEGVKRIDGQCFGGAFFIAVWCKNLEGSINDMLEEVICPESLKEIGQETFSGCHNLKYVRLPEGLLRIEPFAFQDCGSIKEIILPSSITDIMAAIFDQSNPTVKIKKGSEAEKYALKNKLKIEYVE